MCKKQTAVSHSSAESEKILWTLVFEWKVHRHCNDGIVYQKHLRIPVLRDVFRAKAASVILCLFLSDLVD